jgi:hypothetical protein
MPDPDPPSRHRTTVVGTGGITEGDRHHTAPGQPPTETEETHP